MRWIVLVSVAVASVIFTIVACSHSETTTESFVDVSDGWEEVENDEAESALGNGAGLTATSMQQELVTAFSRNRTNRGSLLLISTLDGKLSAIDEDGYGTIMWSLPTGPTGLLSSSISKVELTTQGRSVRLIPSLLGGLYKFDGEAIEPIPINAETLLHSSYQLSDEFVVTGGKESSTYGLDARTGRLQYVCTLQGCQTTSDKVTSSGEFLVVTRRTQTVRAVEPRTGVERWNFSVGQHDIVVLDSKSETFAECDEETDEDNTAVKPFECYLKDIVDSSENIDAEDSNQDGNTPSELSGVELKVIVPDGVVIARDKTKPSQIRWEQKFTSPVVKAWRLAGGQLVELDLFSLQEQPELPAGTQPQLPPLLYIGIHDKQLYVQENTKFFTAVSSEAHQQSLSGSLHQKDLVPRPKLPWKPKNAHSLIAIGERPGRFTIPSTETDEPRTEPIVKDDSHITALIVRHETDYPFDRGFYLYSEGTTEIPQIQGNSGDFSGGIPEEEEEWWEGGSGTPVHIVIVSLWFWWKEVVFISLVTAFVFHVLVTRQVVFFLRQRWTIELQRQLLAMLPAVSQALLERQRAQRQQEQETASANEQPQSPENCENVLVVQTPVSASPPPPPPTPEYTSRYLTDFEPVQCLGRGGFGLVFEARNRLDDCHYAVKRIRLPNSEDAREKVMREVRALAKLDHPHIVRYFHAWLECPPPGWQEQQDLQWTDCENLTGPTPNNTGDDLTSSCAYSESVPCAANPFKPFDSNSTSHISFNNNRNDDSFDVLFDDSQPGADNPEISTKGEFSLSGLKKSSESFSIAFDDITSHDSGESSAATSRGKAKENGLQRVAALESKMYLYIQMQLCRKESLREWLRAHVTHRDLFQVLHMFNEIVQAVEYVHLQGLMHRDLKPSNIFFAPDGSIKIGDFGLVTAMSEDAGRSPAVEKPEWFPSDIPLYKHTDQVGTQLYMSPEQIEGKPYNHKVDIYSLGLIFFELLWPFSTQMEQVHTLSQLRRLKFPQGFAEKHPQEHRLLRMMLSPNPDERPTTFGVRLSPCLVNYQEDGIHDIPEYLRFTLQRPRSATRTSSSSSSHE